MEEMAAARQIVIGWPYLPGANSRAGERSVEGGQPSIQEEKKEKGQGQWEEL